MVSLLIPFVTLNNANLRSWSFGGNRLQIKAETKILSDIEGALRAIASIGSNSAGSLHSLQSKQDLLLVLLEDEHIRLIVWLFPLDHERKHRLFSGNTNRSNFEASKIFQLTLLPYLQSH